jgi:hypothetical protein
MPLLNFTQAILSPYAADNFHVLRSVETVNEHGRTVKEETLLRNVVGVVTAASPNDLMRIPESQAQGRCLSIVTKVPLVASSQGYQPDYIIWRGSSFMILAFDPYPQFGEGFYQAVAMSINHQDLPFIPHGIDFSDKQNSNEVAYVADST